MSLLVYQLSKGHLSWRQSQALSQMSAKDFGSSVITLTFMYNNIAVLATVDFRLHFKAWLKSLFSIYLITFTKNRYASRTCG